MTASETVLAASRPVTAWWSGLGLAAIGLALWIVVDSAGHGLAWALLVASTVVTAPFLAQLVAPARFTWRLDGHGLVARSPLRVLEAPWEDIHLARVVRQAGEPALELQLRRGDETETHLALLPFGADRAALHRALRDHLADVGSPVDTGAEGQQPAVPSTGADDGVGQ
jgi:hypothetical protein